MTKKPDSKSTTAHVVTVVSKSRVFSALTLFFSFVAFRGDELPKMGLLMVILSIIFMSDNVISEGKQQLSACAHTVSHVLLW